MNTQKIAQHYDRFAENRGYFRIRNAYYHKQLIQKYRYLIPEGKKVLEVGCATGDLLSSLKPGLGVGIDVSAKMIETARRNHPDLQFVLGTISDLNIKEKFDYIVIEGLLGELDDIQSFLYMLKPFCSEDTRIVIEYFNYLWQPLVHIAERVGIKMPQREQNWLSKADVINFLEISGYQYIAGDREILFPFRFFGIGTFVNKFIAKLPLFNLLTLNHFIVSRPLLPPQKDHSVSIVVPCRNEKGSIEQILTRTPSFGTHQEFIFIEGWSSDGTYQEIERVMRKYPEKDVKLFVQPGKGKGDAVRFGFSKAKGDILMILDADLTVMPEELPKFYETVRTNKGEFINGCRLVYPMEEEAMRFFNLTANFLFSVFFSWLLGQRFKDTLCGTKVLYRRHYDHIAANRNYFGNLDPFGDFDLIFGAVKMSLKVVELPVRYKSRQYGTTQIKRWQHGWLLLRMCWIAMWKIKFL